MSTTAPSTTALGSALGTPWQCYYCKAWVYGMHQCFGYSPGMQQPVVAFNYVEITSLLEVMKQLLDEVKELKNIIDKSQ